METEFKTCFSEPGGVDLFTTTGDVDLSSGVGRDVSAGYTRCCDMCGVEGEGGAWGRATHEQKSEVLGEVAWLLWA